MKYFLILVVILILITGGYYYFTKVKVDPVTPINNSGDVDTSTNGDSSDGTDGDVAEIEDSTPPDENAPIKYSGTLLAGQLSPLLDFKKADYEMAIKSDKLVVLYFYADWCPICREEVISGLYPAFSKLTNDKVVGFRINFNDNETDGDERALAREFGVVYQHTKVFLKDRKSILKSLQAWDEERYLNEIHKVVGQ